MGGLPWGLLGADNILIIDLGAGSTGILYT